MEPSPDRLTPEEVRAHFQAITDRLDALTATLEQMRAGLLHAATAPTSLSKQTIITAIEHERSKGKDTFKAIGPEYPRYGVRIWPEVLEALGFDVDLLAQGDRYELAAPLTVVVALHSVTDEDTGETKHNVPHKIIGLA